MNSLIKTLAEKACPCRIREYLDSDKDACLEIYRSNEPDFIAEGFIHEFEQFLGEPKSYFLVIEGEQGIIGCGGIELLGDAPHIAGLTFGMIKKDQQRKGLGTSLLAARISLLSNERELHMETSLEAVGFYSRYGFELDSVTPNRLGNGNDYGNLVLDLTSGLIEDVRGFVNSAGIVIQTRETELFGPDDPDQCSAPNT